MGGIDMEKTRREQSKVLPCFYAPNIKSVFFKKGVIFKTDIGKENIQTDDEYSYRGKAL